MVQLIQRLHLVYEVRLTVWVAISQKLDGDLPT
jgi:hypothetical protein